MLHRKGIYKRRPSGFFLAMRRSGSLPNEFTFPFLFKACASLLGLDVGRQLQEDVLKRGLDGNVYVQNTLIHFYGSCQKIVKACNVFDEMSFRTIVSWNSDLSDCNESSWFGQSIEIFFQMLCHGFCPDETTMLILLSACAEIGNLSLGKLFHSQVIVRGMILNCQLGTALVDMYSKCGVVHHARLIFDRMDERNVWTWSAMILGLALHGSAKQALELFTKMKISLIDPNHVTFLGVLFACSHAGLVDDGRHFFYDMKHAHAKDGMWEKAARLRKRMNDRGLKNRAGESCIEIDGSVS